MKWDTMGAPGFQGDFFPGMGDERILFFSLFAVLFLGERLVGWLV